MPLTNTQYDEIMRTYEKRQLDRQQLIDERKKELARIDPPHSSPGGRRDRVTECPKGAQSFKRGRYIAIG
ncbi:MAG: hypothetical protein V8R46_05250 [Eubacterium ramulus]